MAAQIAFWLVRDSKGWLDAHIGALVWTNNQKTMHEQWLGYAACPIHGRTGHIAIFVDT